MHSMQWHFLKIQINQHLEYHKVKFRLQQYLKFTFLRLPSSQRRTNLNIRADDITITAPHINHHLRFNNSFKNILQSITLSTPDPDEYGTTLSLKLNNQILPTTKQPKTLGNTFDPKLPFLQYININLTVIKAKQTVNNFKALTSNKWVTQTNYALLHLKLSFAYIGICKHNMAPYRSKHL